MSEIKLSTLLTEQRTTLTAQDNFTRRELNYASAHVLLTFTKFFYVDAGPYMLIVPIICVLLLNHR